MKGADILWIIQRFILRFPLPRGDLGLVVPSPDLGPGRPPFPTAGAGDQRSDFP